MLVLIAHDLQDLGESIGRRIHVLYIVAGQEASDSKIMHSDSSQDGKSKDPMKACACTAMELQL
jgi:hypothetical protein